MECQAAPIFGVRWTCLAGEEADLCSSCYHGDRWWEAGLMSHRRDVEQPFVRRVQAGDPGEVVAARRGHHRGDTWGTYEGAR